MLSSIKRLKSKWFKSSRATLPPPNLGRRKIATGSLENQTRMNQIQRRQSNKHGQCIKIKLVAFMTQYLIRRGHAAAKLDKSKYNPFLVGVSKRCW